jgi:hypothetical protein
MVVSYSSPFLESESEHWLHTSMYEYRAMKVYKVRLTVAIVAKYMYVLQYYR